MAQYYDQISTAPRYASANGRSTPCSSILPMTTGMDFIASACPSLESPSQTSRAAWGDSVGAEGHADGLPTWAFAHGGFRGRLKSFLSKFSLRYQSAFPSVGKPAVGFPGLSVLAPTDGFPGCRFPVSDSKSIGAL